MARVLPSGRVFGEVHRLPNIQYAKGDDAFGRLEKLSESNLASIAVAGIDRIRKEIALNEAEEAEAKRIAETQKKMKELADQERAWLGQYERLQKEQQQPAATPSIERPRIAVPAVDPTIDIRTIRGADGPAGLLDVNVAGGRAATTRPGEVQWAALTQEQRAFAHAVHSHPLAPTHLQQQAAAYGNDLHRDRTHGWAQHSENTLAKIQEAGFVWDGSRFVAQQPQAVGGVGGWLRSNAEEELAAIQKERAALQKQMQPMPTPRTGAEFIYAVMQETDPQRRKALLYQARNALGDSPATIQEAFSGAATMRMQEKMLKGMSLADAAALAAKEFNVKQDELELKQRTVEAKEKREENYAKRVEAQNEKDRAMVAKLEREEQEASRKAAGATGASKRAHEKRAAIARVIRMHHAKDWDDGRATAEIYEIPGISRGEIKNAVAIITKKREAWDKLAAEAAKADAAIGAAEVARQHQLQRDVAKEDHDKRMAELRASSKRALEAEKRAVREVADKLDAELRVIATEIETIERKMGALDRVRSDYPDAFEKASNLSYEDYKEKNATAKVLDRWREAQNYKNLAKKLGLQKEKQRRKIGEMDARREEAERIDADLNVLQVAPIVFGEPE